MIEIICFVLFLAALFILTKYQLHQIEIDHMRTVSPIMQSTAYLQGKFDAYRSLAGEEITEPEWKAPTPIKDLPEPGGE